MHNLQIYYNISYRCYLLYLFLNKINNIEHGLFRIILSFYYEILPKDIKHILNYIDIGKRFNSGTILVDTIKKIESILIKKTVLPHNLTTNTILYGILRSIIKGRIIKYVSISYECICKYTNNVNEYVIDYDFFIIDVFTTDISRYRIIINPSYEYVWGRDYYLIESQKYTRIRLIDLHWCFKYRKTDKINKYSRFHHKHNLIKQIQDSTIRFFGLSTYYYWKNIEINRNANKLNYESTISLC